MSSIISEVSIVSASQSACRQARRIFVLLHVCTPKNGGGDVWAKAIHDVLESLHQTADLVFRALIEDWTPKSGRRQVCLVDQESLGNEVADRDIKLLGLPDWTGIHAGLERLNGLLEILRTFLSTATSTVVKIPIGDILNTIHRVFSALALGNERSGRTRPEIGRDEREALVVGLPILHVSAIKVLSAMIARFGTSCVSVITPMLSIILWIFAHEQAYQGCRQACYALVAQILPLIGRNTPRHHMDGLSRLFQSSCDDLLPPKDHRAAVGDSRNQPANNYPSPDISDSYLKTAIDSAVSPTVTPELQGAATTLLTRALTDLPNDYLQIHLRAQIDRTAILIGNKEIMLASTMNLATKQQRDSPQSSILPLLAREYLQATEVEALVHPQFPILQPQLSLVDETDGSANNGHRTWSSQSTHLYEHDAGKANASGRVARAALSESDKDTEDKALASRDSVRFQNGSSSDPATQSTIMTSEMLPGVVPLLEKRDRDPYPSDGDHNILKRQRLEKSVIESRKAGDEADANVNATDVVTPMISRDEPSSGAAKSLEITGEALPAPVNQDTEIRRRDEEDDSDESDFEIPQLEVEGFTEDEDDGNDEDEDEDEIEDRDR